MRRIVVDFLVDVVQLYFLSTNRLVDITPVAVPVMDGDTAAFASLNHFRF